MVNTGDRIELEYNGKKLEGILMPRVELMSKDITVLKLDNGYNIGMRNSKIKNVKVIEKYSSKKEDKPKSISKNPRLPNVPILSFGGTISSKIDYRTGGVYADYTAEDFVEMEPALKSIANIEAKKILSIMSEDAAWKEWKLIAAAIHKEVSRDDVDGIVCTVGTDTMHYITAAISFFLKNLNKPVIFTASQRSIDRGSSDAFMNLKCAVNAAANFDGAVVATCMHGTTNDDYCLLIRGTKVRKMHTSRRDAFRPINEKALAKVYVDGKIEIINNKYQKKSEVSGSKCILDAKYEDKVGLIMQHPGLDPEIIDFYISRGYKGLVIAATALGHVAVHGDISLVDVLKKAVKKGIPVVIATQTIYGAVNPYVYTNLRKLSLEIGCIFVHDTLAETAYSKLGYVLAHAKDMDEVKEMMQSNLRGEINDRHLIEDFLN
ncbi:Glu-tRNA(Gln) amidotransferase subunit GatD [Candidatus Woesearchaeota archaeon]|nr:Glu-tRNA(Gln) amidotransferase subunit GatD [Candidatus Woesearchaeota archaeon]